MTVKTETLPVEHGTLKSRVNEIRDAAQTTAAPTTEKRVRPGRRRFGGQQGPLWFLEGLHIDGYFLYFCNDKMPNDPFYIQKLLDPTVGYEYVHPSEVGLTEIEGFKLTDKVCMPVGGGITGYLLKQPLEWHLEDMKAENKPAHDQLYTSLMSKGPKTKLSQIPR